MNWLLARLKLLFSRIQSGQEAADYLGELATIFFVVAAIQAVFGLIFNWFMLIDAAVYAGLALWIYLAQSTLAAILLVLVRLTVFVVIMKSIRDYGIGFRASIFALVTLALSVRAVEATIKLRRAKQELKSAGRPSTTIETGSDLEALKGLKRAGSDLSKPHDAEFFLHFPADAAAQDALAKVKALGFQTAEVRQGDESGEWIVYARKTMKLDEEGLKRFRYQLGRIAKSGGGRYGGWEAAVVK